MAEIQGNKRSTLPPRRRKSKSNLHFGLGRGQDLQCALTADTLHGLLEVKVHLTTDLRQPVTLNEHKTETEVTR